MLFLHVCILLLRILLDFSSLLSSCLLLEAQQYRFTSHRKLRSDQIRIAFFAPTSQRTVQVTSHRQIRLDQIRSDLHFVRVVPVASIVPEFPAGTYLNCTGTTIVYVLKQLRFLYSAGVCTVEGNTGIIAATGTTPHDATTSCFHTRHAISQEL